MTYAHVKEIFQTYGKIVRVDVPINQKCKKDTFFPLGANKGSVTPANTGQMRFIISLVEQRSRADCVYDKHHDAGV